MKLFSLTHTSFNFTDRIDRNCYGGASRAVRRSGLAFSRAGGECRLFRRRGGRRQPALPYVRSA